MIIWNLKDVQASCKMHDNWYDDYTRSKDVKPEAEGGSLILRSELGNFVILQDSKEIARI